MSYEIKMCMLSREMFTHVVLTNIFILDFLHFGWKLKNLEYNNRKKKMIVLLKVIRSYFKEIMS